MDRQNRVGNKPGSHAPTSSQLQIDRKERMRKLAMETIDLSKDPYFMRNHLGQFECKLCLTLHRNEGNYLSHTQGKRHQTNLANEQHERPEIIPWRSNRREFHRKRKKTIKIGRPGYRVVKQRDPETGQRGLLFEVSYPEIQEGLQPRHRFMSAYEQHVSPTRYHHFVCG